MVTLGGDTFVGYGGFTGAGAPLSDVPAWSSATNAWMTAASGLAGRERHGFAYDPVNDRFVVFGGVNGVSLFDTVLLLSGPSRTGTQPPSPTPRPSARADPLLQWVPTLQRFVVFGGRTSVFANNFVADTWTLSVADGGATWTSVVGTGPSARGAGCSAWDPVRQQVILFGGEAMNDLADTWSFAGDGGGWRQLTVTGTVPSARSFAACAFDANLGQLVLYGGQAGNNAVAGLFTFDPATNVWTSHAVTGTTPGALSDSAMAYSPTRRGVVLFGGRDGTGAYVNSLWLLVFNQPPVVDAGAPFSVGEGVMTSLSGSATDPELQPVSYAWTQLQGPTVTLAGSTTPTPSFTTPTVFVATPLRFRLTASDATSSGSGEVVVTVNNTVNERPVVDAGPDQLVAVPGDVVTLMASAVDPNGDAIVGYTWTQQSGSPVGFVQNGAMINFNSPISTLQETLVFEVTARDATLTSLPDSVTVTVPPGAMMLDAGRPDAGMVVPDAGTPDAGTPDAGTPDAGVADSGVDAGMVSDAGPELDAGMDAGGVPDAGAMDAGSLDAGVDAGVMFDAGLVENDAGIEPDAGALPPPRNYAVGCGCSEAPSFAWLLMSLAWFVRRTGKKREQ